MRNANFATCDTPSHRAPLPVVTVRPAAGPTQYPRTGVYSLPATCRSRAWRGPTGPDVGWEGREEGEYYIPELLKDEDDASDPALFEAAAAHIKDQREAMALLDDAENLIDVLLASIEQESDSRAMQADTVLRIAKEKLREAHTRIDRQETRHRNLFLAYFELKTRSTKEQE